MSECHKCKHQAEIERLRAVCLACAEKDTLNNHGRCMVSYEQVMKKHRTLTPAADWTPQGDGGGTRSRIEERIPDDGERALIADVLKPFWQMSFEEWVVAGGKVRGMSDSEIARAVSWSKQRIWEIRDRVKAKWPTFGTLRTGFDGNHPPKGKGRRKTGAARQGELFGDGGTNGGNAPAPRERRRTATGNGRR